MVDYKNPPLGGYIYPKGMKILHICNDFCGSKVHTNLYKEIDNIDDIEQTIFTYIKDRQLIGKNQFESKHAHFLYSTALKKYHRYFYHLKINDIFKSLTSMTDCTQINCVHAVTLFSDGGVALKIHKKYGIPYIVAVRNTDVNYFLKYAPHTWKKAKEILKNAKKIIFISPALQKLLCQHIAIKGILPSIESKFMIQPNGVDPFWLQNIQPIQKTHSHEILYIGNFQSTKNTLRLINAVLSLIPKYNDIKLNLVGGTGKQHNKIVNLVVQNPNHLKYWGKIYDKEKLQELFNSNNLFAMPSLYETFGLVYIEALSQHLPIIYSKGQGIDGLLSPQIGIAVNPFSEEEIASAITNIFEHSEKYNEHHKIDFNQFHWEIIAKKYLTLYNQL